MYARKVFDGASQSVEVLYGNVQKNFSNDKLFRAVVDKAQSTPSKIKLTGLSIIKEAQWVAVPANNGLYGILLELENAINANINERRETYTSDFIYIRFKVSETKAKTHEQETIEHYREMGEQIGQQIANPKLTEKDFREKFLHFWILRKDEFDLLPKDTTDSYEELRAYAVHRLRYEYFKPENFVDVVDNIDQTKVLFVLPPLQPVPQLIDPGDEASIDSMFDIINGLNSPGIHSNPHGQVAISAAVEQIGLIDPDKVHASQKQHLLLINNARKHYGLGPLLADVDVGTRPNVPIDPPQQDDVPDYEKDDDNLW